MEGKKGPIGRSEDVPTARWDLYPPPPSPPRVRLGSFRLPGESPSTPPEAHLHPFPCRVQRLCEAWQRLPMALPAAPPPGARRCTCLPGPAQFHCPSRGQAGFMEAP